MVGFSPCLLFSLLPSDLSDPAWITASVWPLLKKTMIFLPPFGTIYLCGWVFCELSESDPGQPKQCAAYNQVYHELVGSCMPFLYCSLWRGEDGMITLQDTHCYIHSASHYPSRCPYPVSVVFQQRLPRGRAGSEGSPGRREEEVIDEQGEKVLPVVTIPGLSKDIRCVCRRFNIKTLFNLRAQYSSPGSRISMSFL